MFSTWLNASMLVAESQHVIGLRLMKIARGGPDTGREISLPGLDSSIVQALSNQLKALVDVTDAHPGTTVAITHSHLAAVAVESRSAARAV